MVKKKKGEAEGVTQKITSEITDAKRKWQTEDFVKHYYLGWGKTVTLSEIGLMRAIIDHAQSTMFDNVLEQVEDAAQSRKNGTFTGSWSNSYPLGDVFTDPASKRQKKIGAFALEDIPYDPSKPWFSPQNIAAGYLAFDTEYFGTAYEIVGQWTTQITGTILDEDEQ